MDPRANFTKNSTTYSQHNKIQRICCADIFTKIHHRRFQNILELGCGDGDFYRRIDWPIKRYCGIDFSQAMCDIHPKNNSIQIYCIDFDTDNFKYFLQANFFDCIVAPSSLQWSQDFERVISLCAQATENFGCTIFTDNTFKRIHEISKIKSPIQSASFYLEILEKYFAIHFEIKTYKLYFASKKKLFEYIKLSGVGSGINRLSFKSAKKLYVEYDLDYLEFEFIVASSASI